MLKLLTVIGARPQIIKAAALSRAVARWNRTHVPEQQVEEKILHTGQHYDENMSGTFFSELGIPQPDYNLHVGSGTHGAQTAKMIEGIERVLLDSAGNGRPFDGVVLYGDTNSTLAGAVAAAKLHVPVFHIEAGLRSFNMTMPEEQNRIVCDRLSSVLFAPTQTAVNNLANEGIGQVDCRFAGGKTQKVVLSGDVMYDNSMYFSAIAAGQSDVLQRLCLQEKQFILATIHRDNNTDQPERLNAIFGALLKISEDKKIVLPLHPRTSKLLKINLKEELFYKITNNENIKILPPASFLDMILLERHSQMVITDSGGVQKEAFFFQKPCLILRSETEWREIVDCGAAAIADADEEKIIEFHNKFVENQPHNYPEIFGDGNAAEFICKEMLENF